jgi:hypothetical protein
VDLGHLALLDLLGIVGGHVCGSFRMGDRDCGFESQISCWI